MTILVVQTLVIQVELDLKLLSSVKLSLLLLKQTLHPFETIQAFTMIKFDTFVPSVQIETTK